VSLTQRRQFNFALIFYKRSFRAVSPRTFHSQSEHCVAQLNRPQVGVAYGSAGDLTGLLLNGDNRQQKYFRFIKNFTGKKCGPTIRGAPNGWFYFELDHYCLK
jgi:hypothetical protein